MRNLLYTVLMASTLLIAWSCDTAHSPTGNNDPYGSNPTNTPSTPTTPSSLTPTPSTTVGPVTITVSTASSGTSSTGYIYTASTGSNGSGGLLSLTAHVGDTIQFPGSTTHPLYFDHSSSTCIYTGAASPQTYVFPSTGAYYFHCGNHGAGCSGGNAVCGSTTCNAMAGMVQVN